MSAGGEIRQPFLITRRREGDHQPAALWRVNFRLLLRDLFELLHLFHHQHFDGHVGGNKFEAELIQKGLF
jgi:hypothetical protein